MRLIDADRLKDVVSKNFYGEAGADVMCQIIDEQPTAFDKDKVIEELENYHEFVYENWSARKAMEKAIRIVRMEGLLYSYG